MLGCEGSLMDILLKEIRDNLYWVNPETNRPIGRCDDNTACICESIAICFQALIDKIDELKESIDPDPRNPTYR